ncbi:MAG: hypothetical protein HQK50_03080 [Oligoflexia bacterium]|nr:hypothetical protein [Oligoflexia bacterium]MBF0364525.1 hypothetical protein [Oligoflexia bacterium]
MAEFFSSSFGKMLKENSNKTSKMIQGQSVFEVTENAPEGFKLLKKGDQFYLDNLHKDHLEVFTKNGRFKHVLNLDGTYNVEKTAKAMKQGRSI